MQSNNYLLSLNRGSICILFIIYLPNPYSHFIIISNAYNREFIRLIISWISLYHIFSMIRRTRINDSCIIRVSICTRRI